MKRLPSVLLFSRYRGAAQSGHRDGARLILAWTRDIIPRSSHGRAGRKLAEAGGKQRYARQQYGAGTCSDMATGVRNSVSDGGFYWGWSVARRQAGHHAVAPLSWHIAGGIRSGGGAL